MSDETASGVPAKPKLSADEAIAKFKELLRETREELSEVAETISSLKADIASTNAAPPHADDIVKSFRRGLDEAAQTFKRQIGRHLNGSNWRALGAAQATENGRGAEFLTVTREPGASDKLLPGRSNVSGDGLSVAAVTYFLRDKIAAELPKLVAEFCPESSQGMKSADRATALRDLAAKLENATAREDELKAILASAQASIYART